MRRNTTPASTPPRSGRAARIRWLRRALVVVAALSVVAMACGDDGDDDAASDDGAVAVSDSDARVETPSDDGAEEVDDAADSDADVETPSDEDEDVDDTTASTDTVETDGVASEPAAADGLACGLATGQAATGEPIKVGAVVTITGAADFSSASRSAAAYFDCVNANGGINGRPIQYLVEDDGTNPEQAAGAAARLVEDEGVVAMVASTSFLECGVNGAYYAENNVAVIAGTGAPRECFESANIAPVNAGPRISLIGAAQYGVETYGIGHVVCITFAIPNLGEWACDGIAEWGAAEGIEAEVVTHPIETADPTSIVLEAAAKGPDAIVVIEPLPLGVAILQAAEQQDLAADIHWMAGTSLYDAAFPELVGPYWNGRFDAQIELAPVDSTGEDNTLWLAVLDEYGSPDQPRDTFSQSGFLAAKIFTETVLGLADDQVDDRAAVTEALRSITRYDSDLLCGSYYFGPGDEHKSNHAGRVASIVDGSWVQTADCFEVNDPDLADTLALERELGLGG